MEPISMIVAALVLGISGVAGKVPSDAYAAFKALVRRRLATDKSGVEVLKGFEKDPEIYREPLRAVLERVDAHHDSELLKAAENFRLLAGHSGDSYFVQNASGTAIGPQSQVINNYQSRPGQSLE